MKRRELPQTFDPRSNMDLMNRQSRWNQSNHRVIDFARGEMKITRFFHHSPDNVPVQLSVKKRAKAKTALNQPKGRRYSGNGATLLPGIDSPSQWFKKAGPSNLRFDEPSQNDESTGSPASEDRRYEYVETAKASICRLCNVLCYPQEDVKLHIMSEYHQEQIKLFNETDKKKELDEMCYSILPSNYSEMSPTVTLNPMSLIDIDEELQDHCRRPPKTLTEDELDYT